MRISHSLFVLLLAVVAAMGEYDEDFCKKRIGAVDDQSAQGQKPVFHDNFYVFMEMKINLSKTAIYSDEYYSQQSQTMYATIRDKVNQTQYWIDTKMDEIMSAPAGDGMCVDTPLQGSQLSQFIGATEDSTGNVELNTPEVALGWDKKFQKAIKFLGSSSARGMKTLLWNVCSFFEEQQTTTFAEWHIVDPDYYTLPAVNAKDVNKPVLPVMARIQAISKSNPATITQYSYGVDYTFFDNIQATDPIFQLPATLLCQSTQSPQLPTAPSYFKYKGEQITIFSPNMHLSNPVSFLYSNVAYMYELKLYVEDYMTIPSSEGNDKSYGRTVDDFSVGLSFEMDLTTGDCKTKPISSTTSDSIFVSDGIVQMRSPEQFFDLDSSKYQYKGIHNKRGIDCDVWTAYFTDNQFDHEQNTMYTWYFANPEWMKKFGYINWTHPFPVSLDIEQEGTLMYNNYYEFDTQDTIKIPDLSLCFDPSNTMNIEFFLNATYDKMVAPNYGNFLLAIPIALFSQTTLNSFLRISQLDIQPANGNDTVVRFKLLDISALPVSGDVSSVQILAKNSEIYKDLETVINSGTFAVDVQNSPVTETGKMTVYAQPHSLGLYSDGKFVSADGSSTTASSPAMTGTGWTSTTTSFSSFPSPTSVTKTSVMSTTTSAGTKTSSVTSSSGLASSQSGISSGGIAGICIGMLILGAALGVTVFYVIRRFRRADQEERGIIDMKQIIKD